MTTSWPTTSVVYGGIAWFAFKVITKRLAARRLPPGPPKLPLLDNVLNLRNGLDWEMFAELGKQYNSDIIHLSALGNSIIILNSFKAAQELLDQRSGIYSSRAYSTMLHDLSGWTAFFSVAAYGDLWRAARRMFTKHFRLANTALNQPREIFYVRRFLSQLLDDPNELRKHIRHMIGSISISMTYGLKAQPVDDPYIALAEETAQVCSDTGVGTFVVDLMPVLKYLPTWFPGIQFHRIAAENQRLITTVAETLFGAAKLNMETSNFSPSFLSEVLGDPEYSEDRADDLRLMKEVAGQVYLAGADTTVASLGTFFLAMVCHPEAQKKLQEELDSALQGKLPVHQDIDSLPYLHAVLMEVLRWQVALPIALPHLVIMDDVYEGYHIPKNSIVIPNQWAMLTDPKEYSDPLQFKPERFLKDGQFNDAIRSPLEAAFGFGRRACPGRHIALSTLKMTMGSVLSTFDILKKKDADGKVIEPTPEYNFSLIRHPKDIPCTIRPRSRQAEQLITAWASVEGENPP